MNDQATTVSVIEPTVSQQVIDEIWLDEPFESAMVGGVMMLADDAFRLSVRASNGTVAQLAVLHASDPALECCVDVELRSVFDVGRHQVLIGSVGESSVVVSWRLVAS